MTPSQLKAKLGALSSQQLSEAELLQLLRDVVREGGGVTVELDEMRYRIIERDGRFTLKYVERKRLSTIPPYSRPPKG